MINITTTTTTFRGPQQQQNTRQDGDVTVVVQIEVGIKALDRHIEKLEAKLSFLIRSYDNDNDNMKPSSSITFRRVCLLGELS
jgi:hypothetical protein